eukprot:TRINITY_DN913_c0_g1_i1.p2 TRINITY_DN913_c0_g1~~TRINITY_DN913_c0_g1_i1.p2  ORF type:complete len:302 (-),score=47.05 TRINITY_DN913_c0_g1_i1:1061-1966(-)
MKLIGAMSFMLIAAHVALASVLVKPVVRSGEGGGYSYDQAADNGPSHWGSLSDDFASCSAGHHQSPINIAVESMHNGSWQNAPDVRPHSARFSFSNETSNWALHCETEQRCGHTTFRGKRYDVINLHFHSPSEHTVNGKHYPLEAHMVHRSSDGSLLVIGTLFTDKRVAKRDRNGSVLRRASIFSASKAAFHSVVEHIRSETHSFTVHMPSFIGHGGYCTYDGSLTTPPCSEDVTWLVAMQEQAVLSSDVETYQQLAASVEHGNNRPVHPLNAREIQCFRPRAHLGHFKHIHGFLSLFHFW